MNAQHCGGERELECDGCASAWRAAGAPNQLLPTVLLILGTAGVRREVGMNNHPNSIPYPDGFEPNCLGMVNC